ncbi:hypothetical protein [Pelagibaculum spongiae]|nr:hypothetical protein [Pelagibaculum spongiae]
MSIRLMKNCPMKPNKVGLSSQKGQSLAGFLVTAGAILVPLLIGMNYLANVGESRHKLMQAARYSSWERTVWKRDAAATNHKSDQQITREISVRLFSQNQRRFNSREDSRVTLPSTFDLDPMLYSSFQSSGVKTQVVEPVALNSGGALDNLVTMQASVGRNTAALTGVYNTVANVLDLNNEGVHRSRVGMQLMKLDRLDDLPVDPFRSNVASAIQVGAWNASGPNDALNHLSRPLVVPGSLLSGDVTRRILDFAGNIFPELGWFEPGKIDPNLVPCERIGGQSGSGAC